MNTNVITVNGHNDVLSNFHATPVSYEGHEFPTLEHCWAYAKAKKNNLPEEAKKVFTVGHGGKAKQLSRRMDSLISEDWETLSVDVMEELLIKKFDESPFFRTALLETGHKVIAHSVVDSLWGNGLSPELSMCIDPAYWPGENQFGKLLAKLRHEKFYQNDPEINTDIADDSDSDTEADEMKLSENENLSEMVPNVENDNNDNSATIVGETQEKNGKKTEIDKLIRKARLQFTPTRNLPQSPNRRRRATSTPPNTRNNKSMKADEIETQDASVTVSKENVDMVPTSQTSQSKGLT